MGVRVGCSERVLSRHDTTFTGGSEPQDCACVRYLLRILCSHEDSHEAEVSRSGTTLLCILAEGHPEEAARKAMPGRIACRHPGLYQHR